MVNAFKAKFKKYRFWFLLYLLSEIVAASFLIGFTTPAFAQVTDKVSFSVGERLMARAIHSDRAGEQSFLIASNAPFSIIADGAIGDFDVNITTQDPVIAIGANAQLPGDAAICTQSLSPFPVKIYEATRRTAIAAGSAQSQAVKVTIQYDPIATPNFKILLKSKSENIASGTACSDFNAA